jgi:hypothetical protein
MSDSQEGLALSVARIEVKLDQALAQHADHEIRIRRLEHALWMAVGVGLAGGGAAGAIVAKLVGG